MKFSDIKGVFNAHVLKVTSVEELPDGYITVTLDAEGLVWRPGEHGIFTLPGKDVSGRKWRAFSIASTPEEGLIRIGTRVSSPPSGFKSALKQLKPGDKVKLNGPFGWFVLQDDTSPIVLIAGGSGATAAKAVLSHAVSQPERMIHLVHTASGFHLFKDEVSQLNGDKLDFHFTHGSEISNPIIDDLVVEYGNRAYYFVSGPPQMNSAYIKRLKHAGINKKHIIVDPYFGY